jgi:hypothetical protein
LKRAIAIKKSKLPQSSKIPITFKIVYFGVQWINMKKKIMAMKAFKRKGEIYYFGGFINFYHSSRGVS